MYKAIDCNQDAYISLAHLLSYLIEENPFITDVELLVINDLSDLHIISSYFIILSFKILCSGKGKLPLVVQS